MSQAATPDDVSGVFTFRSWKPPGDSWDDHIRAFERAYAQRVDRCRRPIVTEQTPPALDSQDPHP
jgi:hypothetical protein